jgi:hypothetical protein
MLPGVNGVLRAGERKCPQSNNAEPTLPNIKYWELMQRIRPADPLCFWAFHGVGQRYRTNLRALRSS